MRRKLRMRKKKASTEITLLIMWHQPQHFVELLEH